jgi:hypothetical protein
MRWKPLVQITRNVSWQLVAVIATSIAGAVVLGQFMLFSSQTSDRNEQDISERGSSAAFDSIAASLKYDEVLVVVHDIHGNLKSEEKTSNIITTAGAIWFCVQQNRCESQITSPSVVSVTNPTWWVQFISGTPNTNMPTGADCTATPGGGALAGQVSGGRCVTNFGSPPAQYQAGGAIITASTISAGTGQLRGASGTYDTTNNFVQATPATICSIINNGTAPSSGTCQFTDTTPVLTNMSGSVITVNGLALASGSGSSSAAGPLIIAESVLSSPVTLNPGDTISISWTIVT